MNRASYFKLILSIFCTCYALSIYGKNNCTKLLVNESDSLALVALYTATNGENWDIPWELETPIDTWYGVLLNNETDRRVLNLSLRNNNLVGILPDSIGLMSALENLDLGENELTGSIPNTIGNVTNLSALIISRNQLTGSLPTSLGNLTNLVTLNLRENELSASIPAELGSLTNLELLWLQNNQLEGTIPSELGNLTKLEFLWVFNNNLEGNIPSTLGNLESLNSLFLEFNNFTGSLPSELGNLNKLEYLALHYNNIEGSIPNEFGNLTNLKELNVNNNQLDGSLFPSIGNLSKIEVLHLRENQITGTIPIALGNLTNLKSLWLQDNQFEGAIPPELGNLKKLEFLWLFNNNLTGQIPAELGTIDSLISIHLEFNMLEGCFTPVLKNLCAIDYNFQFNPNLPDNGFGFDAFCSDNSYSCDLVWPGDFNNDGIADNNDALYWGLAHNSVGILRPNASNTWVGQDCSNWDTEIIGINHKYQDGDGNGLIDDNDFQLLEAHYGFSHVSANYTSADNSLQFRLEHISNSSPNTYQVKVYIEETTGASASVHGIAFALDFSNFYPVKEIMVDLSNSSLEPMKVIDVYKQEESRLEMALTRTDKENQICTGAIAEITIIEDNSPGSYPIIIEDDLPGTLPGVISISIENGLASRATSELYAIEGTSIQSNSYNKLLQINPNPSIGKLDLKLAFLEELEVQINLFNSIGAIVFSEKSTRSFINDTIDVSHLNTGIYFLQLIVGENMQTHRIMILSP